MKRFVLIFVVLFTLPLLSQQKDKPFKTTSLNFEINSLSLQSFLGGIGGRTWLNDSFVLLASVGVGYNSNTTEETENRTEGIDKTLSTGLNFGVEHHLQLSDNISPYITGRLSGFYSKQNFQPSVDTTSFYNEIKESVTKKYTVLLGVGFGVEFWLTNRISLAGQYLLSFSYGWGTTGSIYPDDPDRDTSSFAFGTNNSAIILAIYF